MATPHLRRDGCWTYNSRTLIIPQKRQKRKSNIRVSAGQMPIRAFFAHLWAEINSKKFARAPPEKSEAEEVRQGKGMPFRRALHTFGTPCTLRCTPFLIEVCRLFLLFSLVYEPFPMLSRLPARHAHLFSNDLYTRERDIYFFIYKT